MALACPRKKKTAAAGGRLFEGLEAPRGGAEALRRPKAAELPNASSAPQRPQKALLDVL
jgi:hypothetical protein